MIRRIPRVGRPLRSAIRTVASRVPVPRTVHPWAVGAALITVLVAGAFLVATPAAAQSDPRCPAQDAFGEGACDLFLGWKWNGAQCESVSGCSCTGTDCGNLFTTLEECQSKNCRCLCDPQQAEGEGECEAILGWAWDGARCHQLVGCSCVGDDCPNIFGSQNACELAHDGCPCARQDVAPVGLCEVILGYYWDGGQCSPLVGCSCSGSDCDELFAGPAECQKAHLKCLCRAQDARGEGPCRAIWGYAWNGESCEAVTGCECVGDDCDLLASTLAECQAVHDDCPCRAMDAQGEGPCDAVLGWAFDGAQCVELSGCSCAGTDCPDLFATEAACNKSFADCLCRPQDAHGEGPCDLFLGWRWDGVECVSESGCTCQGGDCDELFATRSACLGAHEKCACRAQDAQGIGGCALFLGWKWDGAMCVGVSGCSCSGADCGDLFATLSECQTAHDDCEPCCGCVTCDSGGLSTEAAAQ